MLKSFRYRIYPTNAQERKLLEHLNSCRFLYNCALEERISFYKSFKKSKSYYEQANYLSEIKKVLPEFNSIHSQILQDALKRLDKSFKGFFNRIKRGETAGFPRFLHRERYKSFTYPQKGFKIENNRLFLSKIGHIKIELHRPVDGKIKTCSIIRTATEKWFACFSVEIEKQPYVKTEKLIGIDLGIKNFAVTSDNDVIAYPKFLNKYLERLAIRSKKFSNKKTTKNKLAIARTHEKITNCRDDWQHKAANRLIKEYDIVKDSKAKIMRRNINDAAWGTFVKKLVYKAEYADKSIIQVDPRNTSKKCSSCGNLKEELELKDRIYICERCGLETDRDLNAAINIKDLGSLGIQAPICKDQEAPSF